MSGRTICLVFVLFSLVVFQDGVKDNDFFLHSFMELILIYFTPYEIMYIVCKQCFFSIKQRLGFKRDERSVPSKLLLFSFI